MVIKKGIRYLKRYGFAKTLARSYLELQQLGKKGLFNPKERTNNRDASGESRFGDETYRLWSEKSEPGVQALTNQRDLARGFALRPKISVITPVFNPDKKVFIEMIESVIAQTYDRWELCLADASTQPYVREIVENFAKNEKRIKTKYLKVNGGIAENSNEALSMAAGDYVALLDHDDTIAPFALFEVVTAINEYPDVDFIYSDRDIISYDGVRLHPFFKPDWSPDYLLSQNYLCHLNVFKKSLIDRVGFRKDYDGSQDYDLFLRITELTDRIRHIAKILYHWRVVPGSASVDSTAKPYAYDAAIRALSDALRRRNLVGTVTHGATKGFYDIRFEVRNDPKVSIIIPTKGESKTLKKCTKSILDKTRYNKYEIVIIYEEGEASKAINSINSISKKERVKIIKYDELFHLSKAKNYAVSLTNAEYIVMLSEKTHIITEDWIEYLIGFAQRKGTGAVGGKLVYPNETIRSAGLIIDKEGNVRRSHHRFPRNSPGYNGRINSVQNFSAVSAECMMCKRDIFQAVGGMDPQFASYANIDFCLKLRKDNYLIVYEPRVELYCDERLGLKDEDIQEESAALTREKRSFLQKWGDVLEKGDPYYNPNLSPDKGDFSIAV
jgi:glycosyltransferase involved in cell wall biosynthesis